MYLDYSSCPNAIAKYIYFRWSWLPNEGLLDEKVEENLFPL